MLRIINLIKLIFLVILTISSIYLVLFFIPSENMNLVANPGFEDGGAQPSNWKFVTTEGNTPVWDNIHHNGTRSIKISVMGMTARNSGYLKSDLIKAGPQQYYILSAWGKTINAIVNHAPAIRVVELDADKNWLRQTNLVFDGDMNDWTLKSMRFKTGPDATYLYIYANIWSGNGTFWMDDISLSKTSAPPPTAGDPPSLLYNTYYVSKNGNDNNPGTEESPWLTIAKATNTLVAGDTVFIREGTYNEILLLKKSGSPGKFITFAAYPGDNVTIDGAGISVEIWEGLVQIYGLSYINISGFRILNSRFTGITVRRDYETNSLPSNIIIEKNFIGKAASSAIFVEDGKDIRIDGNEITEAQTLEGLSRRKHETISLVNVNGFEIQNNKLYQNNAESIDVKDGSRNGRIHHNDISLHQSAGIYIDAWSGTSSDIEIFSNVIHDGRDSGRGIALAVENGGALRNIKAYNNVIYRNAATGVDISWYSIGLVDNILIAGNTIYGNGLVNDWGGGISVGYKSATNVTIRNNIVSKNNHYSIQVREAAAVVDHNLIDGYIGGQYETKGSYYIEGDPQFINAVNADFHLKSTSPAIGAGSSDGAPYTDFDGNDQGADYDIGAFKYLQ